MAVFYGHPTKPGIKVRRRLRRRVEDLNLKLLQAKLRGALVSTVPIDPVVFRVIELMERYPDYDEDEALLQAANEYQKQPNLRSLFLRLRLLATEQSPV